MRKFMFWAAPIGPLGAFQKARGALGPYTDPTYGAWVGPFKLARERDAWLAGQAACEPVILGDGPAAQLLVPGVAPVPLAHRQASALIATRNRRRGYAPLPSGSLWDDVSRSQQDLF